MLVSIRVAIIMWNNLYNTEYNVLGLNCDGSEGFLHLGIKVVIPFITRGAVEIRRYTLNRRHILSRPILVIKSSFY